MTHKFKIGDKIVIETQWSIRYYKVLGIIKTRGEERENEEWIEYIVERNNTINGKDGVREPTQKEIEDYYN